jgi:hypothetical protein
MFKVTYSATVFNPDTEDTFNGWVDMDWNRFELRTEEEDVRSKEFDTYEEAVQSIEDTIGSLQNDGGSSAYYGEDSVFNNESGEDWHYCGHVEEVYED